MTHPIRSTFALAVLVAVLAACGTAATPSPEPSEPAPSTPTEPSATPSVAPSVAPSEEPIGSFDVDGTITFVGGVSVGGPGGSITDALAGGMTEPQLVNGVLFRDTDGTIYLATSVTEPSEPGFGGPILEVLEYPDSPDMWDMANAELTGLQEANGIPFLENNQLYGVVEG